MNSQTLILIFFSGIIALLLALFQYSHKSKSTPKRIILTALRALSIFAGLLLLINPKFESVSYAEEKPVLVLGFDNSKSISYLKQELKSEDLLNTIKSSKDLNEKFKIDTYTFGSELYVQDSLSFKDERTNISSFFKNYSQLYKSTIAPIVLVTDGNQTIGSDYQYMAKQIKQPIFSVILGDTTTYSDLSISRVNANRYAYLNNKFPVEIITNYTGKSAVETTLSIYSGSTVVFTKKLNFDNNTTSQIVNTNLNAKRVGVKSYRVEISTLDSEKNKTNNIKNFAIEVIDEKTNIALISQIIHPDLGAIKKPIESNKQRYVKILSPNEFLEQSDDFQLVILNQPTRLFASVYAKINALKSNTLTITGNSTDWTFLNEAQPFFKQEITNQSEDFQPILNLNYNPFIIDNISFDNYPPLSSEFGEISYSVPVETILYKSVNGFNTEESLLATFEVEGQKHAVLNGEGIWRWRAQNYLENNDFKSFDDFAGKLVQYLSSNKRRQRLNIDYKSFYNQTETIIISAQYFNKNYEFDSNANLEITYKNTDTDNSKTLPLLLKGAAYTIDLSSISPGDYTFTIKSRDEPVSISGRFKILEFNIEQQFLNPNADKLTSIANQTNGKTYFIDSADELIQDLLKDERFVSIQKSKRSEIPLIDYKFLLALIALALSLEWFIRKYNGLI